LSQFSNLKSFFSKYLRNNKVTNDENQYFRSSEDCSVCEEIDSNF
jgi:hypothetical protein